MYDDGYDDFDIDGFDGDPEESARYYRERAEMIQESQKNDTCGCNVQPCAHYQ